MSPPSLWFSVLLNLNLLKLELGIDYLFLKQTKSERKLRIQRIRGCLAATFSACLAWRKGQQSVGRDPILTCIRSCVPASKKQPGVANLDRIAVLP